MPLKDLFFKEKKTPQIVYTNKKKLRLLPVICIVIVKYCIEEDIIIAFFFVIHNPTRLLFMILYVFEIRISKIWQRGVIIDDGFLMFWCFGVGKLRSAMAPGKALEFYQEANDW